MKAKLYQYVIITCYNPGQGENYMFVAYDNKYCITYDSVMHDDTKIKQVINFKRGELCNKI